MKKIIIPAVVAIFTFANSYAVDLPSGNYTLDKSHASLTFSVNHLGFSRYVAQFKSFDAKLALDPAHPEKARVEAVIDLRSLALPSPPTGFVDELLGKKWLDAGTSPQITFRSTKIEMLGDNKALITGDLTLHGVTRPVGLEATFNGGYKGIPNMDPNARIGFSARTTFKRSDFGISYGLPEPGSNMGVSDDVNVVIETEFTGPALAK